MKIVSQKGGSTDSTLIYNISYITIIIKTNNILTLHLVPLIIDESIPQIYLTSSIPLPRMLHQKLEVILCVISGKGVCQCLSLLYYNTKCIF